MTEVIFFTAGFLVAIIVTTAFHAYVLEVATERMNKSTEMFRQATALVALASGLNAATIKRMKDSKLAQPPE